MANTSHGGRPPSYEPEQLSTVIDILEAKYPAQRQTARAVKDELIATFGISPGLNLQSLERELERFFADREIRRERELVEALPDPVRTAGLEASKAVEKEVLVALGRGYADLRDLAARDVAALEKDKAQLHRRIEQLENEAAETSGRIDQLDALVAEKDRDLDTARDALEAANARIRDLETAAGAETRVIDELSRVLAKLGVSSESNERSQVEVDPKP